jgi:hypothetical protein
MLARLAAAVAGESGPAVKLARSVEFAAARIDPEIAQKLDLICAAAQRTQPRR